MTPRIYLAGAVALAFLTLAGTALYFRGNAIDARAELAKANGALEIAVNVNAEQAKTIGLLKEVGATERRILTDISNQLINIHLASVETARSISDLKVNNATVRDFLDTPIPDALRGVLNKPQSPHQD